MSRYDWYDYDYNIDDEYHRIIDSHKNVKDVYNVSMLRHYLNCWGLTKELKNYLGFNEDEIENIIEYCKGSVYIKELRNNYDGIIAEEIERNNKIEERKYNQYELILQLKSYRDNFCGIGTRKVKLMLNKLGKTNPVALAYRYALEAEDYNIKAKETYGKYVDKNYNMKAVWLDKLIELCNINGFKYGIADSDVPNVSHIIYFEIDGCEQISFHTTLYNDSKYPIYDKEWDGKVNSTLPKLEAAILGRFEDEVTKRKEDKKNKKL